VTCSFTFIGVTTAHSSIMRIFPRWRDLLGLGDDIEMAGWDLPLHAPPADYRAAVARLKGDPANLGALVTAHKLDLYAAARDLFDGVDDYARLCDEVSCLARRDGRLYGWAKDPISAGRTLNGMLGEGYFGRTGADVLIFGAGGAGLAITLYLLTRPEAGDRPSRIVVTDRDPERLRGMRALHGQLGSLVPVHYVETGNPARHDQLVAERPPGSLVVNATGAGKDRPGSPVSDAVVFPEGSIAWELNYRGELHFLRQSLEQQAKRRLRVEDGWMYFIFGWTAVIEEVFQRPIGADDLPALLDAAAFARPPLPTTG